MHLGLSVNIILLDIFLSSCFRNINQPFEASAINTCGYSFFCFCVHDYQEQFGQNVETQVVPFVWDILGAFLSLD